MRLRIWETLREAFGERFFGFAMMVLLPTAYMVAYGWIWEVWLGYIVFWLLVIRFTLD